MNKKEAIAYAQITLENMLDSNYIGELTIENFGIEMKEAFKIYPKKTVVDIAKGKIYAERVLKQIKSGDVNAK